MVISGCERAARIDLVMAYRPLLRVILAGVNQQDTSSFLSPCTPEITITSQAIRQRLFNTDDETDIGYAIRARSSSAMREQIQAVRDSDWKPLIDRQGEIIDEEETCHTSFCIGKYERPFTLIIQRKAVKGQAELDLVSEYTEEEIAMGDYI